MSWKTSLLRKSATNRALPVEIWGRTLVVLPKGDSTGFSETEFSHEKLLLESLVQDSNIGHVIVDLKNSNYFGNDVTAVILAIAEQCRQLGKTCGVCNVSDAMHIPLRELRDNPSVEWFDTRRQAERHLVRFTGSERTKRLFSRRDFRLFLMLVFIGAIAWWVTSLRTRQAELIDHVDRLEKILRQYRNSRDFATVAANSKETLGSFLHEIDAILKDIENDKSEAADEIRAACVENLIPLFSAPWQGNGDQVRWEGDAEKHLKTAYRMLTATPGDGVADN